MQAVIQAFQQGLGTLFSYIPQLIGAIIILIVGYIIAKIVQAIVTRVLRGVGFENWMERGGVKQFFDRASTQQTPSSILGMVAFWFIFIIFLTAAANALGIQQVSGFLNRLIAYIPSIFAAILILLLAGLLANFIAGIVRGATGSGILASVAQYAIIIYAAFAALTELGIAVQLTSNTFLIVLAGVALAAAIAFGWGSRNVAQDIVERAYNRRDEVTAGGSSRRESSTAGDRRNEEERRSTATTDGREEQSHDLIKLSNSDFVFEDERRDIRGREVYDRNGEEIGRVEDLYVDREARRVGFLSVAAGGTLGLGKKHFLIPYEAVSEVRQDRVTLEHDREQVTEAPEFDQDTEPDPDYQRAVYRHYGYA